MLNPREPCFASVAARAPVASSHLSAAPTFVLSDVVTHTHTRDCCADASCFASAIPQCIFSALSSSSSGSVFRPPSLQLSIEPTHSRSRTTSPLQIPSM